MKSTLLLATLAIAAVATAAGTTFLEENFSSDTFEDVSALFVSSSPVLPGPERELEPARVDVECLSR